MKIRHERINVQTTAAVPLATKPTRGASATRELPLAPIRSAISKHTPPETVQAVTDLLARGGAGIWINTPGIAASHFLITRVPAKASGAAKLGLIKVEHSRAVLEQRIAAGVPVVVGGSFSAGIKAVAMGGGPLCDAVLTQGHIKGHNAIVVVQPSSNKYTFVHECQHFDDFDGKAFEKRFTEAFAPFRKRFTPDERGMLQTLVWELRSHSTQIATADADRKAKRDAWTGGGRPNPAGSKTAEEAFLQEAVTTLNNFRANYRSYLQTLLLALKRKAPHDARAFGEAIASFDVANSKLSAKGLLEANGLYRAMT